MNQRGFSLILIIFGFVLILSALGVIFYLGSRQLSAPSDTSELTGLVSQPTPAAILTVIPTTSPQEEIIQSSKTYTSEKLKISFSYLDKTETGIPVTVKETGNKVYISLDGDEPETGQYVEVINKDNNDNLQAGIKRQILKNYSMENCDIKLFKNNKYPSSYQTASISYSIKIKTAGGFVAEEDMDECPSPYTSYGGKSFFLMDQNNPEVLLFFNIGQYAIAAEGDRFWEDTVKIIN